MDWFNFKDMTFLTFFIIMITLFVIIALFIIFASVASSLYHKRRREIEAESNTFRIYVIDAKNYSVVYFDRSSLKDKTKTDLEEFYSHFHPADIDNVKNWIASIRVDGSNAPQYLEADVIVDKRHSSFSLLKLVKYDPETGIIHLENHILRYITPINEPENKSGRNKGIVTGVVKRSEMEQIISREKSIYGYTFAIRFFYIKQKFMTNDKVERYMSMTLKNEIYPFTSIKNIHRQIVELSSAEMLLFDLKMTNRNDAMRLATSISHSLNKCISLNGFGDSIAFSIGIVENAEYYQNFDEIVRHAQEAAIAAQQGEQNIMMSQKTTSPELDFAAYRDTISSLLRSKNLRYLYRPIIDVSSGSVLGFFEYVRAYNSPFTSFLELSKYAERINENRNVLAHVLRYSVPKFNIEKLAYDNRLFFSLSLIDVDNIVDVLPQISGGNEIKMVVMINEQELSDSYSSNEHLSEAFNKLHKAGYEIALSLNDKDLLLDQNIYYSFDYFVTGANMIGEIRKNNRVRLSIHTLIERLLKYGKPIIATDLEGWQAIELIIKSGIRLVSAEAIAASNDMLLPVDKKKLKKLKDLGENYH